MDSKDIHRKKLPCSGLNSPVHPLFKEFISNNTFKKKFALDIGCGKGKYIHYLESHGFRVHGLDIALPNSRDIYIDDMFNFKIPKKRYDLILSVYAMHHGCKENVNYLIEKIYDALLVEGKIFITLPDKKCLDEWQSFTEREQISTDTFVPLKGFERNVPHCFYSRNEIENVCYNFRNLQLEMDDQGRWVITAKK